jgi:hypothetical protein
MSEINQFLNASFLPAIGRQETKKETPKYRIRTTNVASNLILFNYLSSFPLFSSNFLNFLD